MTSLRTIATTTILLAVTALAFQPARGQEEFDFDLLQEAPEANAADPSAEPSAQPAVQAPSAAESAVVAAIRQTNPQTPAELLRAVDQLIRLDRPDVAAEYLNRLVALQLDDAALGELYRQFGTAAMIRLAGSAELAPQAGDFAQRVMQAGRRVLSDPEQLRAWVAALNGPHPADRFRAAEQLLRAGASAVPPLVESIASSDSMDAEANRARWEVLVGLGPTALEPLHAYLGAGSVPGRDVAIAALGRIGARESLVYLVGPLLTVVPGDEGARRLAAEAWQRIIGRVPGSDEAVRLLELEADRAYQGRSGLTPNPDDQVVRWTWDQQLGRPVPTEMRSADAAAVAAVRWYADLTRIRPGDAEVLERYLVSRLTVDKSLGGLDQPLRQGPGTAFESAQRAGSHAMNRVLRRALADEQDAAAIGAAEVLGLLGDAQVLEPLHVGEERTVLPLSEALTHPNRRVRFAAAEAMVALGAGGSFHGAGRLKNVLDYFATSSGSRAAVVAHPNHGVAQRFAGMLSSRGFRAVAVTTARDLEGAATSSADVELVMVSDSLNDARLWSTLENLRAHPHTARLPIAILARDGNRDAALHTAERHARTIVIDQAADETGMERYLPQLLALSDRDAISPQRRLEQAQQARQMRSRLTGERPEGVTAARHIPRRGAAAPQKDSVRSSHRSQSLRRA